MKEFKKQEKCAAEKSGVKNSYARLKSLLKSAVFPLGLLVLLSSCGQNFHLTGFKLAAGVSLPPNGVNIGENYNLSGSCEPDGATVTLSSGDFNPSPVTATCVNGRYEATTPVQFSGTGPGGVNPIVNVSIDDGRGPPVSNDEPTVINNAVPVVNDDTANATFGNPVTVDVDNNDTDAENDMDLSSMNITVQPPISEGVCSLTGAPNYDVTFTPASNFAGTSQCTYELCDNSGLCDTAVVSVVVDPGSVPVANDDSGSAPFGSPVTIDVDVNDTDADSNLDLSSINIQTNANPSTQGVCSVGAAPGYDVTFNPASPNFAGTVTCVYEICDLNTPTPQCDTANAVFTVLPGGAPVANDDSASGPPNSPIVVDVDSNDTDNNMDPSSISITTQPPSGQGVCSVGAAPNYDVTFTPASGYTGASSCTYQICDLNTPVPQCDTAVINIVVHAPPVANDDTASGASFGAAITADHDANDVAGSGTLNLSSTNIPTGGNANPTTQGTCSIGAAPNYDVIFTPVSNFTGTASCTYEICNSNSLCDTASISFDPHDGSSPVATDDTASGVPGSPIVADVDANDSDTDGNLDPSSINIPTGGNANPSTEGVCSVGGAPNYDVTFTPVSGFTGSATCTYEICDLNAPTPQCDTADIVFSTLNPPVANDDTASDPDFGDPVVITQATLLTNDTNGDGTIDPSTISIDTDANNLTEGTCTVAGSSPYDITFTPIANFVDQAICVYEVCDSNSLCDTATITFDPADGSAPVAVDDNLGTPPGVAASINVATNDSDPDSNLDPSSVTLTGTQPNPSTEGSCDASSAPTITFTPVSGFSGSVSCDYSICDTNLNTPQCSTATVNIDVYTPPVANDDTANGASFGAAVTADADSNDVAGSGTLDPSSINIPTGGNANPTTEGTCSIGAAPNYDVIFTPVSNFTGTASCTYEICDSNSLCDTANITFDPHDGAAPVATNDNVSGPPGSPIVADVDSNDNDTDGNLDLSSINIPTGGNTNPTTEGSCAVGGAPNYDVTFTPVSGFTGSATCTYEICDLNSPTPQCDTADVVFSTLMPPVANDDTASDPDFGDPVVITQANILTNDTNGDGTIDPSTISIDTDANNATEGACAVAGSSPYDITFTPIANFVDQATCVYEVCDSNSLCDTATITFDPADGSVPVATNDTASGAPGSPIVADVDANDSDADGNLDLSSINIPSGGNANPTTEGACSVGGAPGYDVTFTPVSGFMGSATCTYEICDSNLNTPQCDTADVTFSTFNPPVANDDTASGASFGAAVTADADSNDTAGDGTLDPSSINIPTGGNANPTTEGTCSIGSAPNYDVIFTPVTNFTGTATCTYEICDSNSLCDTAVITFDPHDGAVPVANNDSAQTSPGVAVVVDVVGGLTSGAVADTDADSNLNQASLSIDTDADNLTEGTCAITNAPLSDITFTPVSGFTGTASCVYEVCDSNSPAPQCDTATLSVTVNTPPTATDDSASDPDFGDPVVISEATIISNDTAGSGTLDASTISIDTDANNATEGACTVSGSSPYDITFTPIANFVDTATCVYEICNSNSLCDTATITFDPADGSAPVANNDAATTAIDTAVTVDVTADNGSGADSDADGNLDSSSVTLVGTQPNPTTEGTCAVTTSPSVQFTPVTGYVGTASCDYQICDSNLNTAQCSTATLTVTVNATCEGRIFSYEYTGSDQHYPFAGYPNGDSTRTNGNGDTLQVVTTVGTTSGGTIEPTVTHIHVKAWGASGATNGTYTGGAGGYSEGIIPINLFSNYLVMTGEQGIGEVVTGGNNGTLNYGFGGSGYAGTTWASGQVSGGGGLSGIFSGTSSVVNTDVARALLISAGGGGGEISSATGGYKGGSGNAGGGESTFLGGMVLSGGNDAGAGGGGYQGGSAQAEPNGFAYGGAGYASTSLVMNQQLFSPFETLIPPETNDSDYASPAGEGRNSGNTSGNHGLVIVTELCAGNNNPPFAAIDRESTAPDTNATFDVGANDADVDGDLDLSSITIDTDAPAAEGACTVGTNPGEVDFAPASGFTGTTSCIYQICDASGTRCDTATLEVTIANPPAANDDTSSGAFGATQTVADVTSNDTDGDNPIDTASVTIDTNANPTTEGTCSVTTSPAVQFVPVANFAGNATCTYQVCDTTSPTALCDTADITFTVGAGSAPVANDDTAATAQGVAVVSDVVGGSTSGAVADTDADSNLNQSSLSITTNANPTTEGTCAVTNAPLSDITFTPVPAFTGVATCTYEVCDSNIPTAQCDTAVLTLTVNAPPVANDDTASDSDFGDPVVIAEATITTNDTAGSGTLDASTISIDTNANAATEGTCAVNGTSPYDITFTPIANFVDTATCTYEICNTNGLCDTADITFDPADGSAPVANDDTANTSIDTAVTVDVTVGAGADTDADGNLDNTSVTITANANPTTEGTCTVASPNVTFTPVSGYSGTATCTYQVCDLNKNTAQCDTADLAVTVTPACGASATPIEFSYTGSDQSYSPTDSTVTHVEIKAWGAGGSPQQNASNPATGGPGGFSSGVLAVSSSDNFSVVVGYGPYANGDDYNVSTPIYGFGGFGLGTVYGDGPGGGLSGFFTGSATVSDLDQTRAILVAGGGGGGDYISGNRSGGSGNDLTYCGGESTMQGRHTDDVVGGSHFNDSGGGGGYTGGGVHTRNSPGSFGTTGGGNGGCGYTHASLVSSEILYTPEFATQPPETSDSDYASGIGVGGGPGGTEGSGVPGNMVAGSGRVVVIEMCAGNSNPPFAAIDRESTAVDTNATFDVGANDADVDGDLDLSSIAIDTNAPVAEGTCTVGSNPGEIDFAPASGFVGTTSCVYEICDSSGTRCDTATLEVEVTNDMIASDDSSFGGSGAVQTVDVIINDLSGVGIDSGSVTIVTDANNGTEGTCDASGSPNVTFTPVGGFSGTATCEYQVCDTAGSPSCDVAFIDFEVSSSSAPVANDDYASTTEGSTIVVDVVGGSTSGAVADTDIDGDLDQSSLSIVVGHSHCSVTNAPVSDITVLPPSGWGTTVCFYEICDSLGLCDTAKLEVDFQNPVIANDDSASDFVFGDPVVISESAVVANDNPGSGGFLDPSTITITNNADSLTEGICAVSASSPYNVTFTPIANYVDTAVCTYQVCNFLGSCDTADITFDPADGSAPVANNDAATTAIDTAVTTDVSGNDTDVDSNLDTSSVTITSNANPTTEGTCIVTTSPNVQFMPVAGYTGTASCDYQICDSNLNTAQCDTATLTVNVNTPPAATDDSASDPDFGDPVVISEATITGNDTAGSGTLDASTISIDTNANPTTEGACAVSGTSPYDITFTPISNFVDTATCTYEICNSNGLCDTADITFDPADGSAPVANNDITTTSVDTAVTMDVSSNDTDADSNLDSSSVTITSNANPTTEGTCAVTTSPNVEFTPVTGYTGTASCDYQVCDSNLNTPQCDTATLTVTVSSPMPTVIIAGINPDINNSNETSYGPVSGDCSEDGEDVDVVFTDSSTPTANTISVTTACSSGNWAITVQDLSGFVDGVVVITADHSDSLGNSATQAVDNVNKVDAADPAEIVFDIFGAPIDYWEDGFRHFCLKLNSTELSCTSGYAAADGDWSTILGAGVTIDRIFVLEATVYVVDSDGDIWSFAQTSIDQRPVGRTGSFSVPAKMSFPSSVGEVVSIAGHHFNACVTFDSGQVWCWHDESTAPVQQIISSAELSIGGFTHHCYIDTVNDLYCSAHDRGETGLPFDISPSLEGSNVVGYVSNHFFDSTFMSFPVSGNPSSLAMYSDGTVSTSFSEDRVGSVQAGFFHSGPGRAVAGNNAANSMRYIAFISFNGQLVHQTQTSSMVVNSSLGNSNLDVGFSYRFNASTVKVSVLRDDGTIYVDDDFTVLNTSSPSFGGSLYNDFIALKAHSMDICGVRANNDIYCAGAYSGGTIASPVFMGTYSP